MKLKIVKFPEPVLSQPGEPVTEFNDELRRLVADMFDTTYASQGIGLAAPQVGVSRRVTVVDVSMGKDPDDRLVLINPEIISSEGKLYDEHGKWFEMDGEDLLARAFQHEIDHLDGVLFIFRMSALKKNLSLRKIRKMQSEGTW
jgi:peptide deformylase